MAKALSEYYFPALPESNPQNNAYDLFINKFAPKNIKPEVEQGKNAIGTFFLMVANLDVREFEKFRGEKFPRQVFESTFQQFPSLSLHISTVSYDQIESACKERLDDAEKKPCVASAGLDFFMAKGVSSKSRADSISYRDTELFLESSNFPKMFSFSDSLKTSLIEFLQALQSSLKTNFDKS